MIELTWDDVYIVKAGRYLTTWRGETIGIVVVGIKAEDVPIWRNPARPIAKIYLYDKKDVYKMAEELGGVPCLSFITPEIKELLKLAPNPQS